MGLKSTGYFRKIQGNLLSKNSDQWKKAFTSSSEGQVIRNHVRREEILLTVFPHVGDMGGVTQECLVRLLVTKMKKPRLRLLGVGLKVKKGN